MAKKVGKHARVVATIAPMSFLMPSMAVGACIVGVVSNYEPLTFDASQFPAPQQTQTALLANIDTSEVERVTAEPSTDVEYSAADYGMDATNLKDGTYTGSGQGFKSTITVQVVISGGKIASITVLSESDDAEYFARARGVITSVISRQSTSVDTVSGATYSSKGILAAIEDALAKSEAAKNGDAEGGEQSPSAPGGSTSTPGTEPGNPSTPDTPGDSDAPAEQPRYLDGEFTAAVRCENEKNASAFEPYYFMLTVVVKNGEVAEIKDIHGSADGLDGDAALGAYDDENDEYIDRSVNGYTRRGVLYRGVLAQLLEDKVAPANVAVVSSATYSSKAFVAAYEKALAASAAAYEKAHAADEGSSSGQGSSSTGPSGDASSSGSSGSGGKGDSAQGSVNEKGSESPASQGGAHV